MKASPFRALPGGQRAASMAQGGEREGTCCMGLRQRLLHEPSPEPENRTSTAQCSHHTCWVDRGSLTRAHTNVYPCCRQREFSLVNLYYLFCVFWRPDSYFSLQVFTLVWLQWSCSWFMLLKLLMQKGDKVFNMWWEVPWFHMQCIYIRVKKRKAGSITKMIQLP